MQNLLRFVIITICFLFFCFYVNAQEEQGRSYYDLGVFAYEGKAYDEAVENFKKALSFNPKDPYYNHYLGKTFLDMELYDEAQKYLQAAWDIDAGLDGLQYDYAFLNLKMSNYEKSADLFSATVKDDPSNILAHYYSGISLFELKRYKNALDNFLIASAKSPTIKANGTFYAGICYRKMGKDKEAVESFEYVRDNAQEPSLRQNAVKWLDAIEEEKKMLKPYSLQAKIGCQYDDNVRLEPLDEDLYSEDEDFLLLGYFSGKYNFINRKTNKLGAGFNYYQNRHDTLTEYDLMAIMGNLYVTYGFNPISFGFDYIPSKYWVDSDEYMLRHQLRPELTWKANENLVTKLSFNYYINDYLQNDDKDGNTKDLFWDNYYSLLQNKWLLFAGLGYDDTDASDDDYYYTQLKAKLGFSVTFLEHIKFTLTGKYHDKKYDNEDSSHGKKREDTKYSGALSLSSKFFWNWMRVLLEYNYTDNKSNIDAYTYQRSTTTLSLLASF